MSLIFGLKRTIIGLWLFWFALQDVLHNVFEIQEAVYDRITLYVEAFVVLSYLLITQYYRNSSCPATNSTNRSFNYAKLLVMVLLIIIVGSLIQMWLHPTVRFGALALAFLFICLWVYEGKYELSGLLLSVSMLMMALMPLLSDMPLLRTLPLLLISLAFIIGGILDHKRFLNPEYLA